MITAPDYAMVAQIRHRELATRIGLAAFIGATAWFMAPSMWPVWWFAAVVLSQVVDRAVFNRVREATDVRVTPASAFLYCVTASFSVVIYSGITVYLWFNGGEAGRLFALVQCAGGLLHVSLHMHHARPLMIAAATPHAIYFLGLPITEAVLDRSPQPLLITVGALLYIAHLATAIRQSSHTTRALRAANQSADQHRRRAEVASAAKSDFLAVVSHEIRTPMNAVISAANLLRRTRLDRDQREHVSMLMDAGDVLMGLLNDVLDFSKIEAGRMELDIVDVDLDERLNALRRLWEPKAMANGVRLRVEVADNAPEVVRADPLRLQQVLFNLISNAVKFTNRGEIVVSATWTAGVLSVAVRDTGAGIPADRLVHIFNSFEQADVGTTRRYGGTGLGLAISRRLAELMGGALTVESVEGRGSTFTLSLPLDVVTPGTVAASRAEPDRVVSLAGRRVLAAEDHEVNRRILNLLLEPHGCSLTLVENGEEAVAAASVGQFDVILMDMQMPVMDGLEATRRIRSGGANAGTPIIALTANATDVHRAAWEAVGVYAFLTKPIDPDQLTQTLGAAASGEPAVVRAA